MPLKKKTVMHKYEGEYQSPDGDIYDCTVVQHGERCYIQWQLQTGDDVQAEQPTTTIDAAMLEGLYEWYLDISGKKQNVSKARISSGGRPGRGLRRPNVTDHRGAQGTAVQSQVKEAMRNYDDDAAPIQSFSPPNAWDGAAGSAEMRYGVSPSMASVEAPDTPDAWKIDKEGEEHMPQWKKDAKERENVPPPQYVKKGPIGERVKRVGAGDIL
jgi:hypothetical protein